MRFYAIPPINKYREIILYRNWNLFHGAWLYHMGWFGFVYEFKHFIKATESCRRYALFWKRRHSRTEGSKVEMKTSKVNQDLSTVNNKQISNWQLSRALKLNATICSILHQLRNHFWLAKKKLIMYSNTNDQTIFD